MSNTELPQFDRKRHGGLHDRGRADRYYGRAPRPHWWPNGTGHGQMINQLNEAEIQEYMAGYQSETDRKDWGDESD